ncbi:hypothetical protein ABEF95_016737 [Exophiala dermatitidis]
MATHSYSLRSRLNSQTPSLRTTPTGSPVIPKLGVGSPRKPRSSEIALQLQKVIGTTTTSPSGLACCPSTETYAYCAGAVAVLAKVSSDQQLSHRYYKARPTAPSINPPTSHYEGSPAASPSRRRTSFAPPRGPDDYNGGTFGRDWLEESGGQTWTARERIKSTSCVALSSNGRWLAVGESGYNPRVLLYSTAEDASGEIPTSVVTDHTHGVRCIAFSADMRYLATLGNLNDGFLFIWSLNSRTGQLSLHSANKCTTNICDMTWCGDNLITVGTRHVKVWHIKDSAKQPSPRKSKYRPSENFASSPGPTPLQGRNCLLGPMVDSTFTCVTSTDANHVILGTETGHLCLVDISRGTLELQMLQKTEFSITSIAFLAATNQVLMGTSEGLHLEELGLLQNNDDEVPGKLNPRRIPRRSSSIRRSLGVAQQTGKSIMAIGVLRNHTITLDNEGSLQVQRREANEQDQFRPTFAAHNSILQGVQSLPTMSELGSFFTWSKNGEIKFWDAEGFLLSHRQVDLEESDVHGEGCENELCRLRYWPAEESFLVGDRFGVLKIARSPQFQVLHTLRAHSSEITSIAVTDEGSLVATCSRDRMVQLFRLDDTSLELLQTMDDHVGSVNQVLFGQMGQRLLSCSSDRSLIIRERVLRELDNDTTVAFLSTRVLTLKSTPLSMTITADDTLVVASMDRRITKVDYRTGAMTDACKLGNSESDDSVFLNSIICSSFPDSADVAQQLIIGYCSMDKSIRVYNEKTLTLLGRESGHTEGVSDVALLQEPDDGTAGNRLTIVTTGLDGTIMLWKISKPTFAVPYPSPDRPQGHTLSSDGRKDLQAKQSPASLPPLRKVLTKVDIADLTRGSSMSPPTPRSVSPVRLKRKTSRLALSTTMEDDEGTPSKVGVNTVACQNSANTERRLNPPRSPSPAPRVSSKLKKQSSRTDILGSVDTIGLSGPRGTKEPERSPSPSNFPISMPTTPKQRQRSNNGRLRRPPSVPADLHLRSQTLAPARRQSLSQASSSDFGSLGMATEQACRMLKVYRKKLAQSAREPVDLDLDDLEDQVCGLLKIIQERKNRTRPQPAAKQALSPIENEAGQQVELQKSHRRGKAKAATEGEVDHLAVLLARTDLAGSCSLSGSETPTTISDSRSGH